MNTDLQSSQPSQEFPGTVTPSNFRFIGNRPFWKATSWPVLFLTTFFLCYFPEWDRAVRAQEPPHPLATDTWPAEVNRSGRGIEDQARALGFSPVRIYEFVRNEVQYEPYAGSRFGAVGTLDRRRGNDVDQAMLLAALLRAAWGNLKQTEPQISFIRGNIRVSGSQALALLGLPDGQAVDTCLQRAGVPHAMHGNLKDSDHFTLDLLDHVWLRGDFEFGAYRGARFDDGSGHILADLDPSFNPREPVSDGSSAAQRLGTDPDSFLQQVTHLVSTEASTGLVRNIPEEYMLGQVDSAATKLRLLLDAGHLSVEEALGAWKSTVDVVESLPESLPYALLDSPTEFPLPAQLNNFLAQTSHKVSLRLLAAGSPGNEVVRSTWRTAEVYATPIVVSYTAGGITPEDFESPQVSSQWAAQKLLLPSIGIAPPPANKDPRSPTVPYGTPLRLEIDYQQAAFSATPLAPPARVEPADDPAAVRDLLDTRAGALLTFVAVPALTENSKTEYYNRAVRLATLDSAGGTLGDSGLSAADGIAPALDLCGQVLLAQADQFFRLGALAGSCRASAVGEWAMVGLEPVATSTGFSVPRLVLATHEGMIPLASASTGATSPDPTASLQAVLQFTREALLEHAPTTTFGDLVAPVTPGALLRKANAQDPTLVVGVAGPENLDAITHAPAGHELVPDMGGLRDNLAAAAGAGDLVLAPASRILQVGAEDARGWGSLQLDSHAAPPAWHASTRTPDATALRAFSPQVTTTPITPCDLIAGGVRAHYRPWAEHAISGVDGFAGVAVSTGRAYVSATPLLSRLCDNATSTNPGERSASLAGAVILLHALLDEFSRPEVLSVGLQVTGFDGSSDALAPGAVINPDHYDKVDVLVRFNQVMQDVRFDAFSATNAIVASCSRLHADERDSAWTLADATVPGSYLDCSDPAQPAGAVQDGPLTLRASGSVLGRQARPATATFTIDRQAPTVALSEFEATRTYSGPITVLGTADDVHFSNFTLEVAPGTTATASDWHTVRAADQAVSGTGILGTWDARSENATGDWTLRLTATDAAGNQSSCLRQVAVYNDTQAPLVSFVTPTAASLTGMQDVRIDVAERPSASPLRHVRITGTYDAIDRAGLVTQMAMPPSFGAVGIESKTIVFADETFDTEDTYSFQKRINTVDYQGTKGSGLLLKVLAEDTHGNVTQEEHRYLLENTLIDVFALPPVFAASYQEVPEAPPVITGGTTIYAVQPAGPPPVFEIHKPDGTLITTLRNPTGRSIGWLLVGYAATWNAIDYSNVQSPHPYPDGDYVAVVKRGDEVLSTKLLKVGSLQPLEAVLTSPMNTLVLRDRDSADGPRGVVRIQGRVLSNAFLINGTREATEPIGRTIPAERPFWQLAYKPHAAPPIVSVLATGDGDSTPLPQEATFLGARASEGNWREITHGFQPMGSASVPVTLADWDLTSVPDGDYDLRLVASDANATSTPTGVEYTYTTCIIPGLKIRHATTNPGDPENTPGALTLRQVDFSLNFAGFPVEVARSYSSYHAFEKGDFGYGWNLQGTSMKAEPTRSLEGTPLAPRLETTLTLPDGRKFEYANKPPMTAGDMAFNAWARFREFASRPYGQHLWLPGAPLSLVDGIFFDDIEQQGTEGWAEVNEYRSPPDGTIACLQLENGTRLLYEWATGRLLRQKSADGHILTFSTAAAVTTIAEDGMGRAVRIHRDAEGRIDWIADPRADADPQPDSPFLYRYEYNLAGELACITNRNGEKRWLYYDNPLNPPHYLTRMIIDRQAVGEDGYGDPDPDTDIVVTYSYDPSGRLSNIDTGAGSVGMEYADNPGGGGGTQTVVDKGTGGRTAVEYDEDGRVTRQTDAAGVVTSYEYFGDTGSFDPAHPAGVLQRQVQGGVPTEFTYKLDDYNYPYRGYEGIAQQFFNFWLQAGHHDPKDTTPALGNDFAQGTTLTSGYLTSQQVQPTEIATPAVGPDGRTMAGVQNVVGVEYKKQQNDILDGTGKVFGVTDPEGRYVSLDYGTLQPTQPAEINGPGGTKVTNTYRETLGDPFRGRLDRSVTRRGKDTEVPPVWTTTYDYGFEPTGYTDLIAAGVPAQWMEFQEVTSWTQNDVAEATISTTYLDALGNTLATVDNNGRMSLTSVDGEGRSVATLSPDGDQTRTFYNAAGLVTATKSWRHDQTEADADVTLTEYDQQGRVISQTSSDGSVTTTEYKTLSPSPSWERGPGGEGLGRQVITTDVDGNRTISETDSAGRQVHSLFEGVEGARRVDTTGYDAFGRQNRSVSARGLITESTFDDAGRQTATTTTAEGISATTRTGYDRFGRTAWTQTPLQADETGGRSATCSVYRYRLDVPADDVSYGQLLGVYHEVPFDTATGLPDADFDPAAYVDAAAGYYEEYGYDTEGRQSDVTKPAVVAGAVQAVTTHTHFNDKGQADTVVFNHTGGSQTPTSDVTFAFGYDDKGNRTSVTYPSGILKEWQHTYQGGVLRSLTETQPGGQRWKTTEYDADGLESLFSESTGNMIAFGYEDSRLHTKTYTLAAVADTIVTTFGYDPRGRSYSVETAVNGTTTRSETSTYDPETGRLESVAKPEGTINYQYDDGGSLASMSYLGRTVSYDYDFHGRLKTMTTADETVSYEYNLAGQKSRVTNLTTGVVEEFEYDALGRLLSIRHVQRGADVSSASSNRGTGGPPVDGTHASGTGFQPVTLFACTYTLGPDGNRLAIDETRNNQPTCHWAYEYDALGRLTREQRTLAGEEDPARDIAYTYDVDSNRLTEGDDIYKYEDNSQRLATITRDKGEEIYTWNANGQLATKTTPQGVETYSWGAEETMIGVAFAAADGSGLQNYRVEYDYDHTQTLVGRRVFLGTHTIPDEATAYLVDNENLTGYSQTLAELDTKTGTIRRSYTYSDELQSQTDVAASGTTQRGFVKDALGSIRGVTSQSAVEEPIDYTAFGSPLTASTQGAGSFTSLTEYAFTGQRRDAATGLQYHRARWLEGARGTWTSGDSEFDFPLGLGAQYVGVGMNPIVNRDASGTLTWSEMGVVGAIVSVIAGICIASISGMAVYQETNGDPRATTNAFVITFVLITLSMYISLTTTSGTYPGVFSGTTSAVFAAIEYMLYAKYVYPGAGHSWWGVLLTMLVSFVFAALFSGIARILSRAFDKTKLPKYLTGKFINYMTQYKKTTLGLPDGVVSEGVGIDVIVARWNRWGADQITYVIKGLLRVIRKVVQDSCKKWMAHQWEASDFADGFRRWSEMLKPSDEEWQRELAVIGAGALSQ